MTFFTIYSNIVGVRDVRDMDMGDKVRLAGAGVA